jgi:hypothetical protein
MPDDPPRTGRVAFWDPDGAELPTGAGEPEELTVVVPVGASLQRLTVPAVGIPVSAAVPVLSRAGQGGTHPTAVFWGAAVKVALQLVARGLLLPGVSAVDVDAWRIGPLDPADTQRVQEPGGRHTAACARRPAARPRPRRA